ncbi:MAG: ThiF family adenylyltransferase [Chitinophagales bacterium]|nr:ThiF family adenylyltransferase [Chitinophagales bacterium]
METQTDNKTPFRLNATANWDDTFRLMSWWDAEKISQASVMVVGAGALGNEVLKNLALLNIGRILIVDFDTIEYSNLCRSVLFRRSDCNGKKYKSTVAAQRIRKINPNIKVASINGSIISDVGLGLFRRVDVIIGCLDNRLARMFINRYAHLCGRTWIDGAIENLSGDLDVYRPGVSCYECELTAAEHRMITYRLGCPDIAMRNIKFGKVATTPISASIIGAMQVQEALKVIYANDEHSLAGQHFRYEGMNFTTLVYPKNELKDLCNSHQYLDSFVEAENLSCNSSVAEVLDWISTYWNEPNPVIYLGYDVIEELCGMESGVRHKVLISSWQLNEKIYRKYQRAEGETLGISKSSSRLSKEFAHQSATLKQLGVPPLQILSIEAAGTFHWLELNADQKFLTFS